MRIVGGDLSGRRFEPPAGLPARPTTDRAREGLFNILAHVVDWEETRVLDLFSGTGGVSYEVLSRGAAHATAVEKDPASCRFIQKTAGVLGLQERLRLHCLDVFRFLKGATTPFDFIFADPPYAISQMAALPDLLLAAPVLAPAGLLVLEHSTKTRFDGHPAVFRTVAYGDSAFSFFRPQPQP